MTVQVLGYENVVAQAAKTTWHRQAAQMFDFQKTARPLLGSQALQADGGSTDVQGIDTVMQTINKAPGSTSVVALPATAGADGAPQLNLSQLDIENLNYIQLLDTYAAAYGAQVAYSRHANKPWNIADPAEAADFVRSYANARFEVITKGLSGVLSLQNATAASMSKDTTSADLHLEFIGGLFSAFGFDDVTMKELDNVLTNVTKSLSSLQMSWSDTNQALDHLVNLYYFEPVQGLPGVKVPKLRLFFLHIDQSSWTASIGKSSISRFQFHMNYDDFQFTMSTAQMKLDAGKIQGFIEQSTGQGYDTVKKIAQASAVHDTRPAGG